MKVTDLTGQKLGRLTVLTRTGTRSGHAMWQCICSCGTKTCVVGQSLVNGSTVSCGCLRKEQNATRAAVRSKISGMAGSQFGHLLVTARAPNSPNGAVTWDCTCDCGEHILVRGRDLRSSKVRSCGCQVIARTRERRGDKSPAWRGGKTPELNRLRTSTEYKAWRKAVFERDDYTCQICGKRGGSLNADHIKSFSKHPDTRFDINNGRTLCVPCHRRTDTFGWRGVNTDSDGK